MDLSSVTRAVPSLRKKKTPLASAGFYKMVTRAALVLLVFLLPLFFLPVTVDALEVNKQTLLVLLTSIALLAWLGGMVVEKRFSLRTGWLNVFPVLFLALVLVSSIFSLAGYQTWVGQASQEYTSFLTLASCVLLFYVLMNAASETAMQRKLFFALFLSAALSGLFTVLGSYGVHFLPFDFTNATGFNTVGTVNALVEFLLIVSTLGIGIWIVEKKGGEGLLPAGPAGMLARVLIIVVTACALLMLVSVDYWVLSAMAIVGMLILLGFAFTQSDEFATPGRFILPLIVLLVSILLLFFPSPYKLAVPSVVSPSYAASWNIARQAASESPMRVAFGTGPGTFVYDYAKYRPTEVNATVFWNVRFDRAKSQVLTTLATMGVAGAIAWSLVVLALALFALARLIRERDHEEWRATYVVFAAWAVLVAGHILYSSNMTLTFLFWLFSGLLASQALARVKESDFARSPKLGLVFSFAFVVVAVAVVSTLFVSGGRYASEIAFAQAVQADRSGATSEEIVNKVVKAVTYNPLSDVYFRNLAQALLARTRDVIAEANTTIDKMSTDQKTQVSNLMVSAINSSTQATSIAPNNVANWLARASTYETVMPLVGGAEDYAAASFTQALTLEPNNPATYTSLGQLHLIVADRAAALKSSTDAKVAAQAKDNETTELAAAEEALNTAISLKGDYAPAHYYLAAVYERQGKLDEAVARMIALRNYSPLDVGIGFQLAMLLIQEKKYDDAQVELERVVGLAPDYANARWFLASLYEIKGDLTKALEQVQKVADLNPNNQDVQARLAKLKAGETTTSIPQPVEEDTGATTSVDGGEVTSDQPVDDGTDAVSGQ